MELVERIIGDFQGRSTGSLIIANVPGLRTSSDIALGERAVLLRPPGDEKESAERPLLFSLRAFSQIGISGQRLVVTRGRSEANATLVVWATEGPSLESDLLRLPLAAINLVLDSPRPILVSESVLRHQGVTPGQSADLFLHDLPADEFPDIVPAKSRGATAGSPTLTDEARRMHQSLLSVVKSDHAMDTAIQMLTSGDSKWGQSHQLRTSLIEYVVALETLLLDQEAELSYRFALRASLLLSPGSDRSQAFDEARSVYQLRSEAVHSGRRGHSISRSDVVLCRGVLKRCVLRYLSLADAGAPRKKILNLLDAAILSDRERANLAAAISEAEPWPVEAAAVL